MKKFHSAAVILLCLVFCISSFAQTTNATLGGTVSDPTGALIPGVTVTARNTATGIVSTALTNEAGAYSFPSLQTGTYTVTVELSGFQTQNLTNLPLGLSQQVRQNFTLQVGAQGTTVDVNVSNDTTLSTTSSSVGSVLPEFRLRELPSGDRNVMELLRGVGGTGPTEGVIDGFFGGNRTSAVNVTRDGFTIGAGRYDQGTFATSYTSSDLVEEVKVTTGTVDAEAGRGSGQVQMVTRSGTNDYHGSLFWNNRNSMLDSRDWFANFNKTAADWENRNQFGGRLGGPIVKNKTFFFFLIDEQRFVRKENFVGTVYTQEARNGIYRYFPGVDNQNAQGKAPTVDANGNPILNGVPTTPTQINLFAVGDTRRTGYDPSGYIQNVLLKRMPLPNDYTVGDGLNTAGIRFVRRYYGLDVNTGETYDTNNRDQENVRLDQNFNSNHKLSFVQTYEKAFNNTTTGGIEQWPGGYNGAIRKRPQLYSLSLVSTLGKMVNEARWGYRGHDIAQWAPWYVARDRDIGGPTTDSGKEALSLLPSYNGIPMQVVPTTFGQGFMNFSAGFGSTRGSWSPLVTMGDTLSWISGAHSFKAGIELRQDGTEGWNDNNFTPSASLGAGNFTSPISTTSFPTLTGTNATLARNIIYNLSGSINQVQQGFDLKKATDTTKFVGYQDGVKLKSRHWRGNEITTFFKDEWKASKNLTLSLGMKWEWYGVPYELNGLAGRPVNGFAGLCGIGCGALTTVEFVGKHSPNPSKKLFNDDYNNFGPALGFSLAVPQLGGSAVVRGGYGVNYSGNQFSGVMGAGGLDAGGGTLPGLAGISGGNGLLYTPGTAYWDLTNVPVPFAPQFAPLSAVPLNGTRGLTMNMYEPNRPVPYIQNFNLSIQRQILPGTILEIAYAGSKGTKLYDRVELNTPKITQTSFLNAFKVTREGGNDPLFDQLLNGLTIPGTSGAVNGGTVRGSAALRAWTSTNGFLANGSVEGLANFLNNTTTVTGFGGGLIRNSGLFPEDFLYFNPQFAGAGVIGNPSSSTYHSLEVKVTKRPTHGFSNETTWTWSKTLGSTPAGRDPSNRNLDRAIASFDRPQVLTSNGTYTLPFGQNQKYLSGAPGWVDKLVGAWSMGGIMRMSSGGPLTLTSNINTVSATSSTVDILGAMPKGELFFGPNGALPTYWATLTQTTAANDPARAIVTTANSLQNAYTNRAILDASGKLLLETPQPGQVGTLGLRTVRGPGRFELDMNMVKRVKIDEKRTFEVRADVVNVLNHPLFDNPNVNINSTSFGQITGTANSPRRFTLGGRLNF